MSSSRPAVLLDLTSSRRAVKVTMNNLDGVCLVDTSGSTKQHNILQDEKNLAREFGYSTVVTWNDDAKLVTGDLNRGFYDRASANWGTVPSSMYDNPEVVEQLKQVDLAVFMTDGEVADPDELARFATGANSHFYNQTLIVCVVVGPLPANLTGIPETEAQSQEIRAHASRVATAYSDPRKTETSIKAEERKIRLKLYGDPIVPRTPSEIQWSVFAPLLAMNHVLMLHLNGSLLRVLKASTPVTSSLQSQFNMTSPPNVETCSWASLPVISVDQVKQLVLPLNTTTVPPAGYCVLGKSRALHLEALLATEQVTEEIRSVLTDSLGALIIHARNVGLIDQLSLWLQEVKEQVPAEWLVQVAKAARMNHSEFYSSQTMSSRF